MVDSRRPGGLAALAAVTLVGLCLPPALGAQVGEDTPDATESPSPPEEATGPGEPGVPQPDAADPEPPPSSSPPVEEPDRAEPAPLAIAAGAGGVTMADFRFSPTTITVSAGDTVTWTNAGPDEAHTATGDGFDTGQVGVGSSGSASFDSPGSFSYVCSIHPALMSGTVVVEAAGAQSGAGEGQGGAVPASDSEAAAVAAPDAAGSASRLPSTGLILLPLALVGAGLIAAGRRLRPRA